MAVKLKSNLYVGPVNIFPDFWHCISIIALHPLACRDVVVDPRPEAAH